MQLLLFWLVLFDIIMGLKTTAKFDPSNSMLYGMILSSSSSTIILKVLCWVCTLISTDQVQKEKTVQMYC